MIGLFAAALVLGALLTLQVGANASLRVHLGQPVAAALVNFLVGLALLGSIALAVRAPMPALANAGKAPWWAWTGGIIGATYVGAAILLAPRLGATLFFGLLVAGQLVGAIVVDHFGWIGFAQQPLTGSRLAGVLCLLAGLALIRR